MESNKIKMKIRINNIEFREYTSTKVNKSFYEIVKWHSNPNYNKEQEYKDNGYVHIGGFLKKDFHSIDINCFKNPESCYVIAFIEKGSESWDLRSVGERLVELNQEEQNDFFDVYKMGQFKLNQHVTQDN
jgi:hypothetical protein